MLGLGSAAMVGFWDSRCGEGKGWVAQSVGGMVRRSGLARRDPAFVDEPVRILDTGILMTAILGISAYYHDSAAALAVDGRIVAAAQEERFTRVKHDAGFPENAMRYCLEEAGLEAADLDYVVFYDKPFLKFERLLETYVSYAPAGFRSFAMAMPLWLNIKLRLPAIMRDKLGGGYKRRFLFCEHHESHAASAFYPSPFEKAAILTLDGVGEWATTTIGSGEGNRIRLTKEIRFPHSLGLLYSAFTYFTGFKVNSGEYKLMGLAPYGEPRYAGLIREKLIDLKEDGSFRMNMDYFNYCQGLVMTSRAFDRLFGGPPRRPETEITRREMDLAASIQAVTEEAMLKLARFARAETGYKHLCLAGGVALNCVGNGRILREGLFDDIWIQPASGDAGGALGAAQFVYHQLLGGERIPGEPDGQRASLLGPAYGDAEIERVLRAEGAVHRKVADEAEYCRTVAEAIADGQVVGWFQGRMEFGPRALGSRSILGDARSPEMQRTMNLKIKFRESFRPFAPIVMREDTSRYFDLPERHESPYMLLVAPVADARRDNAPAHVTGFEKLDAVRTRIPAVTHVDGSARLQTVDPGRNPRLYRMMSVFREMTECPVMVNTSFNVRGEPIVRTPEDAWRCFMGTHMDVLAIGSFIVRKSEQPNAASFDAASYIDKFALD